MNTTLRNILAVVVGLCIGSVANGLIINISGSLIPPPEGADLTTTEGLKASMHLFTPINFLMPFLAHAIGTFVGALLAARIAVTHQMKFAMAIGVVFLIGGLSMVFMLPSPLWFNIVDLVGAYLPMSYLAAKLVIKKQ
ncbi:MAG: hypothetical protein V4651_06515 [Bacteroidota bacterium]